MDHRNYRYDGTPVRLRVYDMDGTLANTEHVADGRRMPFDLLSGSPMVTWLGYSGYLEPLYPEDDPNYGLPRITRSGFNMSHAPAIDLVSGIPVALITRAPVAYASTLAGLLGLERYPIWASSRLSRAEKLVALARMFRVTPEHVVYVGDQPEDRQAADEAGCAFESPDTVVRPALGDPLYPDWWPEPTPSTVREIELLRNSPLANVSDIVRSLRAQPLHNRSALQARLARLVRPEHRYCLVPPGRLAEHLFDYPGVPAYLFAKQEHDETYLMFLRNLFPARQAPAPDPRGGDCHYFVKFRNTYQSGQPGADPLGRLMSEIKDYRTRNGRVRSGAEVQFGGLRLVADVMASHLVDWFRGFNPPPLIDFVRPNDFSEQQPGQTSMWLAQWVAEACSFATSVEWNLNYETDYEWSVLIDDQRTSGEHLAQHLKANGERHMTLTWSWSRSEVQTGPAPQHRRADSDCYWPDSGACPMHDFPDPVFGIDPRRPTTPEVVPF